MKYDLATYSPDDCWFKYKDVSVKLDLGDVATGGNFLRTLVDYQKGDITLEQAANRTFADVGYIIQEESDSHKFYVDIYNGL